MIELPKNKLKNKLKLDLLGVECCEYNSPSQEITAKLTTLMAKAFSILLLLCNVFFANLVLLNANNPTDHCAA